VRTGRELFEIWAPNAALWSPWVSPALFAQLGCPDKSMDGPAGQSPAGQSAMIWHETRASSDTAIILDLPGPESVKSALALAHLGYRPVLLINTSPGPAHTVLSSARPSDAVLDMQLLVNEICAVTRRLQELKLAPDAPPVFILDSRRATGTQPLRDDLFDNRWMVFPQDFPSARFLLERKVNHVVLVQIRKRPPLEDLSHVLLRWQEAGIQILGKAFAETVAPSAMIVSRPSRFRTMWYRAAAMLGLQRSSVGGFGSFLPNSFGGG
jgi:hypothetical protein